MGVIWTLSNGYKYDTKFVLEEQIYPMVLRSNDKQHYTENSPQTATNKQ